MLFTFKILLPSLKSLSLLQPSRTKSGMLAVYIIPLCEWLSGWVTPSCHGYGMSNVTTWMFMVVVLIVVLFHSSHGCSLWVTSQLVVLWFHWLQGFDGCDRAWFVCGVPCLPQHMTGSGQVNLWNWKYFLGSRGHKSLKEHLKLGLSSTYDGDTMDIVFMWMGIYHIMISVLYNQPPSQILSYVEELYEI